MSIPETTSAEGLERYVGGKCLFHNTGEAWRDIEAWIVALPPIVDIVHPPSLRFAAGFLKNQSFR